MNTFGIIGYAGFHNWNEAHFRAELGYALLKDEYKRKGLMKEALSEIISYWFKEMNLHRMEAYVAKDNIPSLKLLTHFNFIQVGLLREHYYVNENFEDSLIFFKVEN